MLIIGDLFAAEPDFIHSETVTIKIREYTTSQGLPKYLLTSTTEIQRHFLTERALREDVISVIEPFYAPITGLKAKIGSRSISEKRFIKESIDAPDVFLANYWMHSIYLPDNLKNGQVFSYSYRQHYRDVAFLPIITVPGDDDLGQFHLIIDHPATVKADFEIFFPRDSIDYRIERTSPKQTELTFSKTAMLKSLDYFPYNGIHAAVRISLRRDGRNIYPETAAEFLNWYQSHIDLKPSFMPENLPDLTAALEAAGNDRRRLRILHNYVRENIRYVADARDMNAYIPRTASTTLERGYGDCKDRAYLISSLARQYGIEVHMALVSSEPQFPFEAVQISMFNHVICYFEDQGEVLFFDPTSKDCEFENLPESDIGSRALVLDSEAPRLLLVKPPSERPSIHLSIESDIEDLKRCKAKVTLRNDYFHSATYAYRNQTGVELENTLSRLITSIFYKISIDYFKLDTLLEDAIIFEAVANLSKFVISSPTRKYIPQTPFIVVGREILERDQDNAGLFLGGRDRLALDIYLSAKGFSADSLAINTGGTISGATMSAAIAPLDRDRIHIQYLFKQHQKRFTRQNKLEYLAFARDYLKNKKKMFILNAIKP